MHASQRSEVIWKILEPFTDAEWYLLTLRSNLQRRLAMMYENSIYNLDSTLVRCVGILDSTKIAMCRPVGHGSLQRSVYLWHKLFHCQMYMTLTTLDEHLFSQHGPVQWRCHDLNLLRQSGWEGVLGEGLNLKGEQFILYEDSAFMLRPYFIVPFNKATANAAELQFNTNKSAFQVAEEWNYEDLKQTY